MKQTGFQERHKIADIWEDDVYVITDQPHKDIPVYTVENQTDETVKTVHHNLLLPLLTILDWMRPFGPDTLVKLVNNDASEVKLDDDEYSDIDDSDQDSDLSSEEPICLCTRS